MKTKRILSVLMATMMMVLMLSTGLTAMAGSNTSTDPEDVDVDIICTFKTETTPLLPNYSVKFEWTDLNFTYTKRYIEYWDDDSFMVKTKDGVSSWDKTSGTITITNNSNVGVTVGGKLNGTLSYFTITGLTTTELNPGKSMTVSVKTNSKIPTTSSEGWITFDWK